jgi:large subunit ribosomal protein L30
MTARKKPGAALSVRQIKSGIGFSIDQKRTLKALGLGKVGRVRNLPDNPQVRGMIFKVTHLVRVESPQDQP